MDLIKEYVANKNLICIDQYPIKDMFVKISSLFENNNKDILICHHSNLTKEKRHYLNIGFTIPNNDKIISLFYKKDYFYFYNNNFSKNALLQFLENASFDNYSQCNICCCNVTNQDVCPHCGKIICLSCYQKIDKCPYCREKNDYIYENTQNEHSRVAERNT